MKKVLFLMVSVFCLTGGLLAADGELDAWCPHVTNVAGWQTAIQVYNPGSIVASVTVTRYDPVGAQFGEAAVITAPAMAWVSVPAEELNFTGTVHLTSTASLEAKLSYQLGASPSVCEFFLTSETSRVWVLPNTVRSWMLYTGVALMNAGTRPASLTLEAWLGGNLVATTTIALPPRNQYLRLSDGIWPGMAYTGFDTLRILSDVAIPSPIDITGNGEGDRHLFFSGRPQTIQAGDLAGSDAIAGFLRYVPSTGSAGFTQGSPIEEPCRQISDETEFTHILRKGLAVMETEVTRQMWADLRALEPSLPADPSDTYEGSGPNNPVQRVSWFEAVLFANLLSAQRGLAPCYYANAGFTTPISAANYTTGPFYCDWNATGYRLPAEGEWEHFCRAGTTTAFWINETNYLSPGCTSQATLGQYPILETAVWFDALFGHATQPVGTKAANPWNLKDVHGNVFEWCWDLYAAAYPTGTVTDYRGAASGDLRVLRGGAFASAANQCRSANREPKTPDNRYYLHGFRLCRNGGSY